MGGHAAPGHARVAFDDLAWQRDVASATAPGGAVADDARIRFERDGVPLDELRACQAPRRDGTQLRGCAKVYLGEHRMIFQLTRDTLVARHAFPVAGSRTSEKTSGPRRRPAASEPQLGR